MTIHKRILALMPAMLALLILTACAGSKDKDVLSKFPLENNGYPKSNYALINGEPVELKKYGQSTFFYNSVREAPVEEIEVSTKDPEGNIELALPKGDETTIWTIEEKNITINSYYVKGIDVKEVLEGGSNLIQVFNFSTDKGTIRLKLHNVDELDKGFDNIEAYYILVLKIS